MPEAKIRTIDFSSVVDFRQHPSGNLQEDEETVRRPRTADGKLLTPKQIRARMRRKGKRTNIATSQEVGYLYKKPIEEWDLEELAAGRPRNSQGKFSGPKPQWITTAVHEESMTRYTAAIKTGMRRSTVDAVEVLNMVLNNEEVDEKGKPLVPASTKVDVAKFLLEHAVGKPTQRVEQDISVKLQGILGQVLVNPGDVMGGQQTFTPAHYPGVTMALGQESEYSDDDEPLFSE